MRTLNFIPAVFRLWLTVMVLLFASCSKEELSQTQDPANVNDTPATLTLMVAHPDAVLIKTKADDKGPYDVPYTNAESAIRNLIFFIFDVDSEGNESINSKQIFEISSPVFTTGIYTFEKALTLNPGKKHIYVAANINPAQRELIYDNSSSDNFKMDDIILAGSTHDEALANVIKDDMSHTGQGTDILMFAQAFSGDLFNPDFDIEIVDGSKDRYQLTAQLKRLVTKVLVTCREGESGFVASGGKFIIPTADIRYCLNTTTKQIYLKERHNTTADINEDTDWILQDYSSQTGNDSYNSHYMYCSGGELISRIHDQRYSTVPVAYDESRLEVNENHYTEGLYCLENTVYAGNGTWADIDATAKFATTHIAMKVRMIPRTIQRSNLNNMYLKAYKEEHDGVDNWYWEDALTSGTDEKDGGKPYPAGTYWALTKNGSTTYYGEMGRDEMIKQNRATLDEFVKYEGGYNWFYTFIEGGKNTTDGTTLSYVGDSYWGLQRNSYYIVNIQSIKQIGESSPEGDFIRINSQTVDWTQRGSQEVVIKPKGE